MRGTSSSSCGFANAGSVKNTPISRASTRAFTRSSGWEPAMKEQTLPTGIKCPECGQGQLVSFTRTEEFDFDLGDETVKVRAENVPIEKCDKCGEVMTG